MTKSRKAIKNETKPTAEATSEPVTASEARKPEEAAGSATYVVAIGALVVGDGDSRKLGQTVKASELSERELAYFVGDGTLTPVTA